MSGRSGITQIAAGLAAWRRRLADAWGEPPERVERPTAAERAAAAAMEHWRRTCPPRYATARLAGLDGDTPADVLAVATGWLARPAGTLVIAGDVGVGKSYLAAALAAELASRGVWATYASAGELFAEMRERPWGELAPYLDAGCLLLDELAASGPLSPWRQEQLLVVVDHRVAHLRPTIVTTNASWEMLREYVGLRVADRFREDGTLLCYPGASRRRPAAGARP
ncbi:MAG TPA: ATP-binding protein [Acidimicrobiales bacterium]|nr:ATP-binding protein [Acidimicrobiales bacterium]